MDRTLFIALTLLTVAFTGCLDGDGGAGAIDVAWVEEPQDMRTGEPIEITWELIGEGEVQHTGLHWANTSVEDPSSPADYGNTSGAEEPAEAPGEFTTQVTLDEEDTYHFRAHAILDDGTHIWTTEVEIQVSDEGPVSTPFDVSIDDWDKQTHVDDNATVDWSLTGLPDENVTHTGFHWADISIDDPQTPADYGNSTGVVEPAQVPGEYSGNFSEEQGTYYGRAHAIYDGQHYWSTEVTFNFTQGEGDATNGTGANHTVNITDDGLVGAGVEYDPDNVTVQPGDMVIWHNDGSTTHGITWEEGNFSDPGSAPEGENITWEVPSDAEPGTYNYTESETSLPTEDPQGQVTVEANEDAEASDS